MKNILIFGVLEWWLIQLRETDSSFVFIISAVLLGKIVGILYGLAMQFLRVDGVRSAHMHHCAKFGRNWSKAAKV